MLCNKNTQLESRNFKDNVDFGKDDPCIFVVYPPGASGDLLLSILDKHYLRTGCEYYGIDQQGKLHFYTTDYELIDQRLGEYDGRFSLQMQHINDSVIATRNQQQIDTQTFEFDQQFFWDLSASLGNRNLNYSLLDQVLFGCHMAQDHQVQSIIDTFPKAQVIRITASDQTGTDIMFEQMVHKLNPEAIIREHKQDHQFRHERVLELRYGTMFNEQSYYQTYNKIIEFLNLKGRVVHWDYVQYYLSKQRPDIAKQLIEYSYTLDV